LLEPHLGLLEVGEEALWVLAVKEAPDTLCHHCFFELAAADLDCKVEQGGEKLPAFHSPVGSQFQAATDNECHYVRTEVLTAVTMKNVIIWDVMLKILVVVYSHFRGKNSLNLQSKII
jgi:hypothetical protein